MEKDIIKQHGKVGGGQVTTDYKPITNNQLDPGSNPGGAIDLVSSGWLLVCGDGKPFTLPSNLEELSPDKLMNLISTLSEIRNTKDGKEISMAL
jgi:hypothetical protein